MLELDSKTFDTPEFKSAFWNWFDELSSAEKKKFNEFPIDSAEMFFYNKVYSKQSALSSIGGAGRS